MAEGTTRAKPLSPHLQIWGWTVTMASSITHRATGVALYSGTIILALWVVLLNFHAPSFAHLTTFLASPIGVIILSGYTWALIFHLMNGIRHLYWDSGRGLNYETAKKTAWFIFIASFVVSAFIVWSALSTRGAI